VNNYSDLFLAICQEPTKKINIILEIEGAPQLIALQSILKKPLYGDPDLVYGMPGLLYGGFLPLDPTTFNTLISIESSLMIGQTVEPEQGRSSLQQITVVLIDKDQYFTNLLSPGIVLDEPLGNKLVKLHLGFQETSYPQDYVTVFIGYISSLKYSPGKYFLQLSDAGGKQRAQLFYSGTSSLTGDIDDAVTTIPVNATVDFFKSILGPDGTYDLSIKTYILIDSEVIEYNPTTGIGPTSFTSITRGVRFTAAAPHTSGTKFTNTFQLQGNGIDLALKLMLSGWDGPYLTGITCLSIQDTVSAGIVLNSLIFSSTIDVNDKYGLTSGDWITVSGSVAGNNGTYQIGTITSINGGTNNQILITTNFPATESPATTVLLSFRSQYDTLPINMGLKMSPLEVDVLQHQTLRNQFFSQTQYTLQFYITDRTDGKSFIENEIMLVFGAYRITRFGRVSMTIAKPPIAGSNLPVVDKTSVIDPVNISVERSVNNRLYYNEIQYRYDVMDDHSTFLNVNSVIDSNSLSRVKISSVLPIQSLGLRTTFNALQLINSRGKFLLNRYKTGAIKVTLKVNWRVGATIETGDVVLLNDKGGLQLPNFNTGTRDLGSQLFEVIDRKFDIKTGQVTLGLLGNLSYALTDRFATIAPSSLVVSGSTTTMVLIKDSFGALFPDNEQKKWTQVIGTQIQIRSDDYTTYNELTTLTGFDPGNPYAMIVSPALPTPPLAGYTVEVGPYPTTSDKNDDAINKLLWTFADPTVLVVTGVSNTAFTVGGGDIGKFLPGQPVLIHDVNYSVLSPECIIDTIVGNQVNLKTSLGFTPSAGQFIEDIGFLDGGAPYKIL
jgi:hypothetical protein